MSKSIYQQLIDGQIDVDHMGETLSDVALPVWLQEIGTILKEELPKDEEESKIMDTLVENDVFSGFLALGLQQAIVAVRATARPSAISGELKGEKIDVSILTESEGAKSRASSYKPKDLPRPKRQLSEEEQAGNVIKALINKGMTMEEIMEKYGS